MVPGCCTDKQRTVVGDSLTIIVSAGITSHVKRSIILQMNTWYCLSQMDSMSDLTVVVLFKDTDLNGFCLELDFDGPNNGISNEQILNKFTEYVEDQGIYDEELKEFNYELNWEDVKCLLPLIPIPFSPGYTRG